MTNDVKALLTEDGKRILDKHLAVGRDKPVSYLPIKTIETVIGITIQVYASLIEKSGNKAAIFGPGDCSINSGAVYAYSCKYLTALLKKNEGVLMDHGWPVTAADFIRRMATEWLDEETPIMPVIRRAFGDEQ